MASGNQSAKFSMTFSFQDDSFWISFYFGSSAGSAPYAGINASLISD
jgi:hypothetical protein